MSEQEKEQRNQGSNVRYSLDPNSEIAKKLEPDAVRRKVDETMKLFRQHRVRNA
jgi:hypothetical protein